MKAELNNPTILKTSFEAISNIVDEAQLECDTEGIRLRALDRSHIVFCKLELKESLFNTYQCPEPEKINIDTSEFMKVLKRAKNDDLVELETDETNLIIRFMGDATRTFKIRMIDMEYEAPNPPAMDYDCNINLPVKILKDSVGDIGIFSDNILFCIDQDHFIISADGDFGDARVKYIHCERVDGSAESLFSLDKINSMLKAEKFSDTVDIGLGDDLPLTMCFEMVTGDGEISFLLAPRLDSGDD